MNPSKKTRSQLEVDRIVLPNGLILLLSESDSIPSVSINAVVQAGSRFESDAEAGLASLVGEMIDEGTTSRTSLQIAEAIEAVGGRLAAYGDYQSSGVALLMLSKDAGLGLEIAADLLMNSVFPDEKLRLQIDRRVAQIRSRYDVPRNQASDEFNELVFAGSPQHRPSIGYEDTVVNLTWDSVDAFYRRHYNPANTILSIVGDIDRAVIRRQVEDLFGDWRNTNLVAPVVEKPSLQSKPLEKFIDVRKEQVNIFVGHLGVERTNADYFALVVMETILGSSAGFTSRIPRILRDEQGLAYTTFANITSSAGLDAGRFVAYIGTSPENLDRALDGLRGEIARIVEEPVSQQEVDVAKAYLTGSFVFKLQKNAQVADFLTDAVVYGLGFDYPQRYPEIIRGITVDDVTRVARTYLHPDRLTTVVVGPVAGNAN